MNFDRLIENNSKTPAKLDQLVALKFFGMIVCSGVVFAIICFVVYGVYGLDIENVYHWLTAFEIVVSVLAIVMWLISFVVLLVNRFDYSKAFKWIVSISIIVYILLHFLPVMVASGIAHSQAQADIDMYFWMLTPINIGVIYTICFGFYTAKLYKNMKQLRRKSSDIV